ncbi:MAG TPA: hypothetical protein VFG69_02885 [Nannocystaceae bacterium]|nr:hypothetical protein [Nannocystaceae bacterium]
MPPRPCKQIALCCLLFAFGCKHANDEDHDASGTGDDSGDDDDGTAASADSGTGGGNLDPAEPDFAACGGAIFDSNGVLVAGEYEHQARLWDRDTIDCRLGPDFATLHPDAVDERPIAWEPPHQANPAGYLCKTFELSGDCGEGCDYGSTAGQVLYAPDDELDPGVDRVQTYGYESGHICESPVSGDWLQGPHPDAGVVAWSAALGRDVRLANGFAQSEMHETNAGIMIFPDGLVGATGNQTAGDSKPFLELPANKVPTSVAVTLYNEFAFVTLWDTDVQQGQIAVLALRATAPEAFSVPYFGLPNEGGFQNIQLLGYIDLPDMRTPTAISANGNNGRTPGGHVIGFEFGTMMDDPTVRQAFARDDYERWVPTQGHAVVISRWEGKATFIDLSPLFQFVRKVYFGTEEDWQQAKAQDVWPYSFESNPEMMPLVVATLPIAQPTAVRVGNMPDSSPGLAAPFKAWIADLGGTIHLFDISAFASDTRPVPPASITEIGSVVAGENITSMSLLGGYNNDAVVASRGDRSVAWVHVGESSVEVVRRLTDMRLEDPVRVDANDRGPVVTVADFHGKQLVTFRTGRTEDNAGKPPANYGCGENGTDTECTAFECGGVLPIAGMPYFVGTTNVN